MESFDDRAKKLKLFEYEFCNLIVNLNLPIQDVEPLLNFTKKYTVLSRFLGKENSPTRPKKAIFSPRNRERLPKN